MWSKVGVVLSLVAAAAAILEGPNVCIRQEPYTTTIRISEQQPYQVREQTWCFSVPPRCSKYKIKFKQVFKTQVLVKSRPVDECCAGYAPDTAGTQCVPVCVDKCVQGKCIAPNTCACDHGYGGPACDISCPVGKWGRNCQNPCHCLNGGTCEPLSGECSCAPGWRGQACERACAAPTFGDNCGEICRCQNNATCDAASGACDCLHGFTGPLCGERCPNDDEVCPQGCRCQNHGKCNGITGDCECTAGWDGEVCANKCPSGKWGAKCETSCECANGASCHHVTGHCHCEAGYTGEKCVETCPIGTYGVGCSGKCLCEHGGECSHRDGACTCKLGWKGERCEQRACSDGKYGVRCEKDCECNPATTDLCDPWNGSCDCKAGWGGEQCSRQCPLLTYGKGCRATCRCENSGLCSPVNGSCLCAPGYRGLRCEEPCPYPLYGDGCRHECECKNNATCSHETGQCECKPGFDGLKCDRACDGKNFGHHCLQLCNCENNAPCDPVNGECICGPGLYGARCEHRCPAGYFGQGCANACNCTDKARGCHHVTGQCICESSWKDVFGTALLYDTVCGDSNATGLLPDADEIVTNRTITTKGDFFQTIYLLKHKKSDGVKEVSLINDIARGYTKNYVSKEIGINSKSSALNQCVSWSVNDKLAANESALEKAAQILDKLNLPNPKAIVAILSQDALLNGSTMIWGISLVDGKVNVNDIFLGTPNKSLDLLINSIV